MPAGATVIDAANKIITPGWIESATNIGIVEIGLSAEGTADQNTTDKELSAAFNVVDAFNPLSTVIPVTRVEGITRALVAPGGTGNVILGQAAVFDLGGEQVPASITKAPAAMFAVLGEAGAALAGGSRASAILRLRETLQDAIDFNLNRAAWNAARRRDYARGRLDLEALGPVIRGEIPLAIQAHRASDMLAAIRLAEEFKLKVVLLGAAEGWMIAGELARKNIPVVVKPLTNIPSFEALSASLENAARLQQAGVTLVLSSFDTHNARNLRQEAGNAVSYGLDRDCCSARGHPHTCNGLGDRRSHRLARNRQGRRPRGLVRRSFRVDDRRRTGFHPGERDLEGHAAEGPVRKISNDPPLTQRRPVRRGPNCSGSNEAPARQRPLQRETLPGRIQARQQHRSTTTESGLWTTVFSGIPNCVIAACSKRPGMASSSSTPKREKSWRPTPS